MESIKGSEKFEGDKIHAPVTSTRWALVSLALSMLLSSMGVSIPNVALPTLAQHFNSTFSEVQWIILVYLLSMTVFIVSVGRLGDVIGRRKLLLVGVFLFAIAALFCALASALWILIAARAVQGLGAAVLMTLTIAFVSETVSKEKTGSAMGMLGTMSAIGTAAGPSVGGLLIAGFGWRAVFLFMMLLGFLCFYLSYRFLPAAGQKEKFSLSGFDGFGTVLMGVTLTSYALGVTIEGGPFNQLNIVLFVIATVVGILFLRTEKRSLSPLVRLELFRSPVLSANLLMNVFVATVMMSTLIVGPFFLSRSLGLNEALVGMVMSVGPLMSILTGVPAGRIADRLGAPSATIIGLIEMLVGVIALIILPTIFGLIGYIISAAILSPGYQLFQAANNTTVMVNVSSGERGVVSGMLSLSRNLGLITGASVMGAIFSFGSNAGPPSVARGMQLTFAIAGFLVVLALLIAIRVRVREGNKQKI